MNAKLKFLPGNPNNNYFNNLKISNTKIVDGVHNSLGYRTIEFDEIDWANSLEN